MKKKTCHQKQYQNLHLFFKKITQLLTNWKGQSKSIYLAEKMRNICGIKIGFKSPLQTGFSELFLTGATFSQIGILEMGFGLQLPSSFPQGPQHPSPFLAWLAKTTHASAGQMMGSSSRGYIFCFEEFSNKSNWSTTQLLTTELSISQHPKRGREQLGPLVLQMFTSSCKARLGQAFPTILPVASCRKSLLQLGSLA